MLWQGKQSAIVVEERGTSRGNVRPLMKREIGGKEAKARQMDRKVVVVKAREELMVTGREAKAKAKVKTKDNFSKEKAKDT